MLRKHEVHSEEISDLSNTNIPINIRKNMENVPLMLAKLFVFLQVCLRKTEKEVSFRVKHPPEIYSI